MALVSQYSRNQFQEIPRRDLLKVGSLGAVGLTLLGILQAAKAKGLKAGSAKSCILFYLEGGPAQQDLWDMKPKSPLEYRGEFRPIATKTPCIEVCEHLSMLAKQMHHLAQVRSVHHRMVDHNAGTYYMLTGRTPVAGGAVDYQRRTGEFPAVWFRDGETLAP